MRGENYCKVIQTEEKLLIICNILNILLHQPAPYVLSCSVVLNLFYQPEIVFSIIFASDTLIRSGKVCEVSAFGVLSRKLRTAFVSQVLCWRRSCLATALYWLTVFPRELMEFILSTSSIFIRHLAFLVSQFAVHVVTDPALLCSEKLS